MANSVLNDDRFHSEAAAFAYVESQLWPAGSPTCPHCGEIDRLGRLEGVRSKPSKKNPEGVARIGLWKCYGCRGQFTVRKGTIFEDSALPLRLWLQAIHLLCASKKGISTRQLQRMLGCGMKTAWHLGHRIRFAMDPVSFDPMGGVGETVEADETEIAPSVIAAHAIFVVYLNWRPVALDVQPSKPVSEVEHSINTNYPVSPDVYAASYSILSTAAALF